jgi:predicted metal-dependent phosphoesterase TrpH
VEKAAKRHLAAVALTDHDTVSGLDAAEEAGQRHAVEVVRGCEIAVTTPYGEAHLVGLWLPRQMPVLSSILETWRKARMERIRLMADKLTAAGMPVSPEEVAASAGGHSVGRPHIALLLVEKGFVRDIQEAFAEYLGEGKPVFVPRVLPDPRTGSALLRAEGATVVFAHPMLLHAPDSWLDDFVADLRGCGLDALEAYHSDHTPEDVRRCLALAERHGLALSGGSDYHGEARSDAVLGRIRGGSRIPVHILDTLKNLRRSRGLPV